MEPAWSALVIDDDAGIRQSLRLCLESDHARVLGVGTVSGALDALERSHFDVVFLDLWLNAESGLAALPEILRRQPGVGVIVITAFATFESAVEAMKMGAVDYLPKPFTPEQVRAAARRVVTANVLKRQLVELQDRLGEAESESTFETRSPAYASFLQTAARAAASDAVVLLRGESGSGKTVFARWMRKQSRRASGPFVTVQCPMLSSELMSSTLFGHCRVHSPARWPILSARFRRRKAAPFFSMRWPTSRRTPNPACFDSSAIGLTNGWVKRPNAKPMFG